MCFSPPMMPRPGRGTRSYQGGITPNNILDTSFTLNSLWSQPVGSWHVTEIPAGTTLTINGAMQMPNLVSLGTNDYALWVGMQNNKVFWHTIAGAGQLVVDNPDAVVTVRSVWSTGSSQRANLDLSGLDTFTANVVGLSAGGDGTTTASVNDRPQGTLYLAKTNFITSSSTTTTRANRPPGNLSGLILTIGDSIVNTGPASYVYLGDTNVFLGDSGVAIGWRRGNGTLQFWSAGGVAYFRNRAGTGRQNYWAVGDNLTGTTGFSSTGVADFTLGTVDAMVDTMYVGRGQSASSGSGTGTLKIGSGLVDVNSLDIGYQKANNGGAGKGTVETSGGGSVTNLIVNGNLRLGPTTGGTGASTTSGTLTINSAVVVKGNIMASDLSTSTLTMNDGSLWVGGRLGNVGGANDKPIGTLNLWGGVLTLNLGTAGNPVTPVCNVNNLNVGAITLNLEGAGLSPGVIPVMKYYGSGGFAGITGGTLPAKVAGTFSNSTDTLYFVVTGVDTPKWNGNVNGDWDINTTPNWVAGVAGTPITYQEASVPGDSVLFDDTASGTTTVNLTTTLSPLVVTVDNSTKTYTFTGSGRLSGPTGLSKQSSGTFIFANSGSNDFTGPVSISGGKMQIEGTADRLPTDAVVTLSDAADAVLDLNGQNQWLRALAGGGSSGGNVTLGSGTLTLSGNGSEFAGTLSGTGQLIKTNSGTQILSGDNLHSGGTVIYDGTLTVANSSGSGVGPGSLLIAGGTLRIGNGGAAGSVTQGVITNNSVLQLNRSDDLAFTNVITGTGNLLKSATDTVFIPQANTYTGTNNISDGALRISDPGALGTSPNPIAIGASQYARLELSNNITLTQPLLLGSKGGALNGPPHVVNVSGTNTLTGTIMGTTGGTDWVLQSDADKLVVSGSFTNTTTSASQAFNLRGAALGEWQGSVSDGASSANKTLFNKKDAGTWVLTSSSINTYSGATTISGGTLVMNGAILNSASVLVNGAATLAGNGLIVSPVTIASTAFLSPGSSIGTLTISNALTLAANSTCVFDVGAFASDQIRGLTTVNYDGTLQVVQNGNLSGNGVFKLFDATSYTGSFASFDLPSLTPPLTWDTDFLTVDGTLRIVGGPEVTSYGFGGTANFQISGTGSVDQPYRILATTNVSLPASSWTEVSSGTFAGGMFSFTDTDAANHPQRFYRVVSP